MLPRISRIGASLSVLLVGDLLHPVDGLAVQPFLNCGVRHRRRRARAVPVLFVRRKPDHVALPKLLDGTAPSLSETAARSDDEGLPQRMRVPRRSRAWLER